MSNSSQTKLYSPSTILGRLIEHQFDEQLLKPVYFLKKEDINSLSIEEFRSEIDEFLEDYNLLDGGKITAQGLYLIESSDPSQELVNNLYYEHKGPGMKNLAKHIDKETDLAKINLISYFSSSENVLRGVLSHLDSHKIINSSKPRSKKIPKEFNEKILIEALQLHTNTEKQELPSKDYNEVQQEVWKIAKTGRPVLLPYIQEKLCISRDKVLLDIKDLDTNYEIDIDRSLIYLPRPKEIEEYTEYRKYLESKIESNPGKSRYVSFFKVYRNFTDLLESETNGMPEINEFVYSFIDPKNELAKQERNDFIGERSKLQEEVNTINRKLNDSRHPEYPVSLNNSKKIYEALGDIISHAEDNNQDLRIMSPWIDDSSQSFISSLRRAIKSGVKVKILMRNGTKYDWRRLTRNFLEKLGEDEQNIEIRTYTRFKQDKSKKNIKQDLKENNGLRNIFGIHGKIYMAGDEKRGIACISSANLMENSLRWNAEAGVLTTSSNVIQPAREFFDMIWEISETVDPKNITYEDTEFRVPGPYRL